MDTASLIRETYKEIVGIDTIEGTNFAAIFGHLVGMFDCSLFRYPLCIHIKTCFRLDMMLNTMGISGVKFTVKICLLPGFKVQCNF